MASCAGPGNKAMETEHLLNADCDIAHLLTPRVVKVTCFFLKIEKKILWFTWDDPVNEEIPNSILRLILRGSPGPTA